MKLTQLFLCSATLALPLTLQAATQKSDDRWFDVEIILFSQLGDKSQLKENFPDSSVLPQHKRVEDLLSRYLNPDIRGLKQLLPSCTSPQYGENLLQQSAKLPALFTEKSLAELAQLATQASELTPNSRAIEQNNSQFSDDTHLSAAAKINGVSSTLSSTRTSTEGNAGQADSDQNSYSALSSALNNAPFASNTAAISTALTESERAQIQRLVLSAENEFQTLKFQYTPSVAPKILCKIDEAHFADYQRNIPNLDYYGFSVDKVPLLIDGKEEMGNNNTHLLSKASFQLDDIIKDLRYSKNFKPLLHMGWRQVARPEKESIPVRVYAGENFAVDHRKKLDHFNKQQSEQPALTLQPVNQQSSTDILTLPSQAQTSQDQQLQMAKKARIEAIIAQVSQIEEDTEALLTSLNTQDLASKTANNADLAPLPPEAPVQPWFIDGFFNIHLKHYLFITADFNILDKNLAELATAQLAASTQAIPPASTKTELKTLKSTQAKAIRFKQDRRVISGEVHYFDHPYLGMIVQIRPYTRPEPETEEE